LRALQRRRRGGQRVLRGDAFGYHASAPRRRTFEGERSMATGTVKWFDSAKGFGFITLEGGGKDAFVHISAVEQAGLPGLVEGQKIAYDVGVGKNGKEAATNLKKL
jgi:cold shock protein